MRIEVSIRYNYGTRAIYPVCPKAQYLAILTGTKTFTDTHIETIKRLGYIVAVVSSVPETL